VSSQGLTRSSPVKSAHRHDTTACARSFLPAKIDVQCRPGPEAAGSAVKPARRLAFRPVGTIRAAHGRIPASQTPPAITAVLRRFRCRSLDLREGRSSTPDSREPSRLRSTWSKRRRSRYLPLKPPALEPGTASARRGAGPEDFFVVHVPVARRRSSPCVPETRHCLRHPGRHPMPHPCSRHRLSTRSTQRAVVFALLGSTRAPAHRLGTALDIRSGADPCESMALRIQN
jgi:hypothetical protein